MASHRSNIVSIEFDRIAGEENLDAELRTLLDAAKSARERAYAPYSEFKVGAAVLLNNGEIISGNNQENAAYPSGLCAERVALFAAKSAFPNATIVALAVYTNTGETTGEVPSPCGSCRQVMLEYEFMQRDSYRVLMAGSQDTLIVFPRAKELLPFAFTPEELKKA